MLDVVYVGYYVALDVVIVVVCCCCIHPLHGDVFMCRNHMIMYVVQVGREWCCCMMLFMLFTMLLLLSCLDCIVLMLCDVVCS